MGLLGALKGVGDASASIGQTGVNYAFQNQRDESEALRQRAIAKYSQQLSDESWAARNEITNAQDSEKAVAAAKAEAAMKADQRNYDAGMKMFDVNADMNKQSQRYEQEKDLAKMKAEEDRKTEAAKGGQWDLKDGLLWKRGTDEVKPVAGDGLDNLKPTNSAKEYQELLNLGVPEDAARTIAYSGSIKSVSDPNSGATVLIDLSRNGEEVGRFERTDPNDWNSPMQWKIPSKDGEATTQAPPGAVEYLKQNPALAPQFKAKYGYLPEGFDGR